MRSKCSCGKKAEAYIDSVAYCNSCLVNFIPKNERREELEAYVCAFCCELFQSTDLGVKAPVCSRCNAWMGVK